MMFEHLDRAALEAALRDARFGEEYKARIRAELAGRGGGSQKPAPSSTLTRPARRSEPPALSAPSCTLGRAPVLRLVLYGPPRTKKTSNQVVFRGGKPKVLPSAAWLAWKDALRDTGQLPPPAPLPDRPYRCRAIFWRDADRGDLVGYQQGLADVLESLGVVGNDRWLQSWDGTRLAVDRACPRVEVELWPLDDPR